MNGCDQQVKPVLETFSDKITFLGPAGSGHLVKALNNALLAENVHLRKRLRRALYFEKEHSVAEIDAFRENVLDD